MQLKCFQLCIRRHVPNLINQNHNSGLCTRTDGLFTEITLFWPKISIAAAIEIAVSLLLTKQIALSAVKHPSV